MSKPTKRDASEAFGDIEEAPAVSKKRTRRKGRHRESNAPVPVAVPKAITHTSTQPSATNTAATEAVVNQPTTDPHERTRHVSSKENGDLKGPAHKKRRKHNKSPLEKSPSADSSLAVAKKEPKPAHKQSKDASKQGQKRTNIPKNNRRKDGLQSSLKGDWDLSIQEGYFLDQDPLLSKDEQHLILPTRSHIHVYSAGTSLLVRSLFVGLVDPVTSCTICPPDSEHILVSTLGGKLIKFNWVTGKKSQQWKVQSGLIRIYGLRTTDNGYLVLAMNQSSERERDLSHFTLHQSSDVPMKDVVVRSKQRMAATIVTVNDGRLLVASSGDKLMLGSSQDPTIGDYTWREFTVPGRIVSFDARSRQASNATTKTRSTVDVALGLQDGAILIYDDVLGRLKGKEKGVEGSDMVARRLHWHRELVSSVKWSRDGNYLVSGGRETVLVLWQLDTNQQQYLPHLSAPICNVVVSISGSSYAMRMADNTVMVLSTSDLVPKTNISGLSVERGSSTKLRATISPKDPDQLLLATPSDLSTSPQPSSNQGATMLQTFNLRTSHQMSRQALARNTTTVINVDPKGRRIVDPDVMHLEVSHDGLWLVTVDEWVSPETDREPLDHQVEGSRSLCKTETFLRFWSWKDKSQTWEMTTRIDQPHSAAPHSVLGTTVNPVRAEFASAGSDGYVRIWAPMLRIRNGQPIRGLAGESLYTWTCLHERRPDLMPLSQSTSQAESATLAYSEDGSTIAVSYSFPVGRTQMVHFIDSRTGLVRHSDAQLCSRGDVQMKFSGHHLLLLSDEFSVWDVVRSERVFYISFKNAFVRSHGKFLAANPFDRTFALALNPPDFQMPAVIAVFDASRPGKLLYQGKIHGHVKTLLPRLKGPGYVVVDGQARIVQMKPGDGARENLNATSKVKEGTMKGLKDIFGSSMNNVRIDGHTRDGMLRISNGEGAALTSGSRPKSLEDVLEQQTFSAPLPVSELFERVASLFRKSQ